MTLQESAATAASRTMIYTPVDHRRWPSAEPLEYWRSREFAGRIRSPVQPRGLVCRTWTSSYR
jgi:hypothetical protein